MFWLFFLLSLNLPRSTFVSRQKCVKFNLNGRFITKDLFSFVCSIPVNKLVECYNLVNRVSWLHGEPQIISTLRGVVSCVNKYCSSEIKNSLKFITGMRKSPLIITKGYKDETCARGLILFCIITFAFDR